VDLIFEDGSTPKKVLAFSQIIYIKEIIDKFLAITEKEKGAIAVHCKVIKNI